MKHTIVQMQANARGVVYRMACGLVERVLPEDQKKRDEAARLDRRGCPKCAEAVAQNRARPIATGGT